MSGVGDHARELHADALTWPPTDDEGMAVTPEPGLPIWLVLLAAAVIVAAFLLALVLA